MCCVCYSIGSQSFISILFDINVLSIGFGHRGQSTQSNWRLTIATVFQLLFANRNCRAMRAVLVLSLNPSAGTALMDQKFELLVCSSNYKTIGKEIIAIYSSDRCHNSWYIHNLESIVFANLKDNQVAKSNQLWFNCSAYSDPNLS